VRSGGSGVQPHDRLDDQPVVLGRPAHPRPLGWQQRHQLGPLRIREFSLGSCHGRGLYPPAPSTLQTRPCNSPLPPPFYSSPCHAKSRRVEGTAGPYCGELGDAGDPSARYSAARTARLRAARRRRLKKGVEKVFTARRACHDGAGRRHAGPARASRIRADTSIDAGSSSWATGSCSGWSSCQAGERQPKPHARLVGRGLHAAAVARVTDPVVVVSSGARACPLGVRGQQRVGPWSSATPPGPNTAHQCAQPSKHLSSRPS
jgi:hypothetical protein